MSHHDVGGRPSHEPIPRAQHAFAPWELRVDALMMALIDESRPGGRRMSTDELRRGIESLSADDYEKLSYYSKWLRSMIAITSERGLIDADDVSRRAAELAAEHESEHGA
jgi:hypothetical protein